MSTTTGVFSAVYSGVAVYEMICRDVPVMRRVSDSYMNATQILKVAGFSKPKRTKILEKEVLLGEYEKIQGGYGKYQGTWIPIEASIDLCKRYEVDGVLSPLIYFDPAKDPLEPKPTFSRAASNSEPGTPKLSRNRSFIQSPPMEGENENETQLESVDMSPLAGESSISAAAPLGLYSASPLFTTNAGEESYRSHPQSPLTTPKRNLQSPRRRGGRGRSSHRPVPSSALAHNTASELIGTGHDGGFSTSKRTPSYADELKRFMKAPRHELDRLPKAYYSGINWSSVLSPGDRLKEIISLIYVSGDSRAADILSLLKDPQHPTDLELQLALDESGNTPLHWAAGCAQLKLVATLIDRGCHVQAPCFDGDTPLMRAITLPGNYRAQTFPELLILLRDSVYTMDPDNQSLLHHVSRASSTSHSRWKYARYYSQCVIDFLKREMTRGVPLQDFIDAQDVTGNTALHYACKQKNFKMVDLLLSLGARSDIYNMSGTKALDLASKDSRILKLFPAIKKEDGSVTGEPRPLFQTQLLDDDIPTPYLSDESDCDEAVRAAEYLVHAQTVNQLKDAYGQQKVPQILSSLIPSENPKVKNEESQTTLQPIHSNIDQIHVPNSYQIAQTENVLTNMRDTLFEIARKRDALNQMHDKAKLAKEREPIVSPSSQSYDMEDRQMSTQSTDSLGQLLKEHITELQEKIESVKSNRKRLFDEIDEIQQERQSKDRQYESNIASLLDNPPQLNDWMKID